MTSRCHVTRPVSLVCVEVVVTDNVVSSLFSPLSFSICIDKIYTNPVSVLFLHIVCNLHRLLHIVGVSCLCIIV